MSSYNFTQTQQHNARMQLTRAKIAAQGIGITPATTIGTRDRTLPATLSSAQQRMWFAQCLLPDDTSYNLTMALLLEGPLDIGALRVGLGHLAQRHSILRTRYRRNREGDPIQVLEPNGTPVLSSSDLDMAGDTHPDELRRAIRVRAEEFGRRPFDLAQDSPLRATLLQVCGRRHVLLIVLHHIAADEVTWRILLSDWSALYAQQLDSTDVTRTLPVIDYADYAVWEQNRLHHGELDAQLDYWTQHLAPLPPRIGFPGSVGVRAPSGAGGDRYRIYLPVRTLEGVRMLAEEHRVTEFMVTLASFAILLHRCARADDLVIGIPVVNRLWPEIAGVAGNFGNTMAIRLQVTGDRRITQLLRQVRDTCVDAYANSEIPFDAVVRRVVPDRSAGRSPLFDVMFSVTRSPAEWLQLPGLTLTEIPISGGTPRFDLSVELVTDDTGSAAALAATYRPAKYTRQSVRLLLTDFVTILDEMAANPQQKVNDLPQLPSEPVDRAEAPRVPVAATASTHTPIAPRDQVERRMRQLCARVFGFTDVSRLGVTDNFFDLGAHSLSLARLQAVLEEQLQRPVALLDMYEHPTVASLAQHLDRSHRAASNNDEEGTDRRTVGTNGLAAARERARLRRDARAHRLSQRR